MKKTNVAILACPVCRQSLDLTVTQEKNGDIVTGTLVCRKCGHAYPIEGGIPNLMPPDR